jgi:(p)ppGpp synthase/HD superfamily hydrolase
MTTVIYQPLPTLSEIVLEATMAAALNGHVFTSFEPLKARLMLVTTAAARIHDGQMYSGKSYFNGHLGPVSALVASMAAKRMSKADAVYCACVAFLHDALEDHAATYGEAELKAFITEVAGCESVTNRVVSLSRVDGTTYEEYIQTILNTKDLVVLLVKAADLTCNLQASVEEGNAAKVVRYSLALLKVYPALDEAMRVAKETAAAAASN